MLPTFKASSSGGPNRELDPLHRPTPSGAQAPLDQPLLLGDEDGAALLVADPKFAAMPGRYTAGGSATAAGRQASGRDEEIPSRDHGADLPSASGGVRWPDPFVTKADVLGGAQELAQLPGRGGHALQGLVLDQNCAAKIRVAGVDGGRHGQGREEAEQGPKLVLDDERVTRSAAGRREHDRLVGQRARVDEVEQVLEQARVGALVDRAANDEGVGGFDRLDHAGGVRRGDRSRA